MMPHKVKMRFRRRFVALGACFLVMVSSALLSEQIPKSVSAVLIWLVGCGMALAMFLIGLEMYRTKYNPLSLLGAWGIRSPTARGRMPQIGGIVIMLLCLIMIGVFLSELLKLFF